MKEVYCMEERKMIQKLKKKKKKKRIKYLLILEILLVLILIPIVYLYIMVEKIPTYDMDDTQIVVNGFENDDVDDYRNIAIFGVDSRANELDKNTRSDSIIVASINKKTKDVKLISIFRDTYVNIQDHGFTKINHAYSFGGPELAISTINTNFDLNITDFVTVNFSALTNVIDLLGGITLDITEAELKYVNDYARDVAKINGTTFVRIQAPGEQVVDGTQATGYCRVRYTKGGDFTRAERQRTVIQQILKKSKSSPTKLIPVVNEMLPQIYTSLSTTEILSLASGIGFYDITEDSGFPFEQVAKKVNGASVVLPITLSSNVTELHKFYFGTENYVPSSTVQDFSSQIEGK